MVKLLIIADDLTGANDTGVQFSKHGIPTLITLDPQINLEFLEEEVVVVDLETRHLSPQKAADKISDFLKRAMFFGIEYFYKKTDSTLRGNVGAELTALMASTNFKQLVYVPAFPQLQRYVKNGYLYIGDKLLHKTEYNNDILEKTSCSYIPDIISKQSNVVVNSIPINVDRNYKFADGINVFDGKKESDLIHVANLLKSRTDIKLFAGPAAFAQLLLTFIQFETKEIEKPSINAPLLFVNGSLNPTSINQVSHARASSIPTIVLPKDYLYSPSLQPDQTLEILDRVQLLKPKNALIISTPQTNNLNNSGNAYHVAQRIGVLAAKLLATNNFKGCVVFGGDTLLGVLNALASSATRTGPELLPGVPLVNVENSPVGFISKAGGFGPKNIIEEIIQLVKRQA
jgi:D-threonate/D-erythronate kinase